MAKYDQYKVTGTPDGGVLVYSRELSVLFEEGDDIGLTIAEVDETISQVGGNDPVPLKEQLLAMPQDDFRELIVEVWIEQMAIMGNGRYSYANDLRSDVSTAQNA